MKKRLRILVVTFLSQPLEEEIDVNTMPDTEEWWSEQDIVRTLRELGHEVRLVLLFDDVAPLREAVVEFGADVVFNLVDEFRRLSTNDYKIAAYLELLGVPYTGTSPRGLLLAKDKALSKVIMRHHRIKVPEFVLHPPKRAVRRPKRLPFPLIVKTLFEEGSVGISQRSVVKSEEDYQERVAFIHRTFHQPALVERYIHGRELYAGVIGNERLHVLPLREIWFGDANDNEPRIASYSAKWDDAYRERRKIDNGPARDVPDAIVNKVRRIARKTAKALHIDGYGRMDLRVTEEGQVYVLEANPNPCLNIGDDFAEAANAMGIDYPQLLTRLLRLAFRRHREGRRAK